MYFLLVPSDFSTRSIDIYLLKSNSSAAADSDNLPGNFWYSMYSSIFTVADLEGGGGGRPPPSSCQKNNKRKEREKEKERTIEREK